MRRLRSWTPLIFALSLVAGGCQTKSGAIEGAGFSLLTPGPATRDFIIKNDRSFANQVAGNNRACKRSPACVK